MKKNIYCIWFILIVFALSGCATKSPILKESESLSNFDTAFYKGQKTYVAENIESSEGDRYRVFHQGASGFVPMGAVRNSAIKRTEEFCKRKGGEMLILSQHEAKPPYILGNFPRIEIIFTCVKSSAKESTADGKDKYDTILKLKNLLDDGALSEEEYEVEKTKVLENK